MRRFAFLPLLLLIAVNASAGSGRILIINNDLPGKGFNDPTPATPVGGNEGTTRGQQRLNVFLEAARRWSTLLDTDVDIRASASFAPIEGCTASEGILGQAAPQVWIANFPAAPRQNVWYPIGLANKFAGRDLCPPGANCSSGFGNSSDDIFVQFNATVDEASCLGESSWYYGFDGEKGDDIDLFVVVLHELAHGLGIAGASTAPGFRNGPGGTPIPSITDIHTLDVQAGLRWDQMSQAQRNVSITNTGRLAWDGENVRAAAGMFLQPQTTLTITEPSSVARNYDIGRAAFGTDVNSRPFSGRVVQAVDAATTSGPTTTDGCTPFTNANAIAGNVALVDRGSCLFVEKARNAQNAGATGLIVVDNSRETCTPPGMGGEADDITITVVSIGAKDGDLLKAPLGANTSVSAQLRIDPSQRAGETPEGYLRLYAPCTVSPGSSTHHWDVAANPNLLMEPDINSDLLHGVDLTVYQLLDIGWTMPERSGRRFLKR